MVSTVTVGGRPRARLLEALAATGVRCNESATTLLAMPVFEDPPTTTVRVVQCSVRDLAPVGAPTLPVIVDAALRRGLTLCPPATGPFLRLAATDQTDAPDTVMSAGRAPSGSLTIASPDFGDGLPTGFYLRTVAGIRWLRGYHCTAEHVWSARDVFVFALPGPSERV